MSPHGKRSKSSTFSKAANSHRIHRISDQLQMELAKLIQQEVEDPRVKMVTLTGIEVLRDLAHAKIYFNVHDEAANKQLSLQGLKSASGFLRRRLASILDLRVMPLLHFHYDDTLSKGLHIEQLLNNLD